MTMTPSIPKTSQRPPPTPLDLTWFSTCGNHKLGEVENNWGQNKTQCILYFCNMRQTLTFTSVEAATQTATQLQLICENSKASLNDAMSIVAQDSPELTQQLVSIEIVTDVSVDELAQVMLLARCSALELVCSRKSLVQQARCYEYTAVVRDAIFRVSGVTKAQRKKVNALLDKHRKRVVSSSYYQACGSE